MSDPVQREPLDEPAGLRRAPVYNDLRDDYDDEFGGDRTPLGIARSRVLAPAVAFVVIGILAIVGALFGAIAAILDFLGTPQRSPNVVFLISLLAVCSLGPAMAAAVIAGGICLKNLRRRGLALTAAYIVTGLSLAGPYGLAFYPFGIWALVLLYQPEIREQFRRPPDPVED